MGFGESISAGFANYFNFRTRATRSEYWYFILFNMIVYIGLAIIDTVTGMKLGSGETAPGLLSTLYSLGVFLPGIGVSIRRLHDTDRSGLWMLISLIPCIGGIIVLVYMIQAGTPGENKFGPPPA